MKKLKRIPFKVAYKIREFLRRNFYMKLTYKFPHYSPHVGGKGRKFDKATEFNIYHLTNLISEISNTYNPVEIISISNLKLKSDLYLKIADIFNEKGSDKSWQGKYEKIYGFIFETLLTNPKTILEIGIGSKSKKFLSYMGKNETTGASLKAFKELFPVLIRSSITTTGSFFIILPSICLLVPCAFGSGRTYIKGLFKISATSIPIAIDPVATPAT